MTVLKSDLLYHVYIPLAVDLFCLQKTRNYLDQLRLALRNGRNVLLVD